MLLLKYESGAKRINRTKKKTGAKKEAKTNKIILPLPSCTNGKYSPSPLVP
jgi:hypothetical protein